MERVPVISNALEELAEAVSSGPISPPSPLACTVWIGMSALQKGIRRGRKDLALRAAATLLKESPERLWRRCGVIAFEDIGVADLATVGKVVAALGGKTFRAKLGGEWLHPRRAFRRLLIVRELFFPTKSRPETREYLKLQPTTPHPRLHTDMAAARLLPKFKHT